MMLLSSPHAKFPQNYSNCRKIYKVINPAIILTISNVVQLYLYVTILIIIILALQSPNFLEVAQQFCNVIRVINIDIFAALLELLNYFLASAGTIFALKVDNFTS